MLVKILYKSGTTKSDFVKHSYSANCHFLQEVFNETKSRNIDSLNCLIASGVLKTATAENIAGSGLNLHHLQLIWQRDGKFFYKSVNIFKFECLTNICLQKVH